jgi:hypothetical protein
MANEGLSFARGLTDRFIQFSILKQQQRREDARQQRFEQQLQDNRRFNQERIDIARENAATARIRALQGPISLNLTPFSPTQLSGSGASIEDVVLNRIDQIPIDTSGRRLFGKDKPDKIKRSDIESARNDIQSSLGISFGGTTKGGQMQFIFDSGLQNLLVPESGKTVEIIEDINEDGTIKETKTVPQSGFPRKSFQGAPAGFTFSFTPRAERQTTTSTTPQTTFPNATQDRAALLRRFRELGGSQSAEARKFAQDNGLLQ